MKENIEENEDKFYKVLNSDRYQYTESSIYLKNKMENQIATFDIFVRTKEKKDFAIVYGIDEVLELIDIMNNTDYENKKKYLNKILEDKNLIEYISNMKFTGSIKGVRNGEIVFTNEPIMSITAPLIQGKILETPILNILNYQILTATTSAKIVKAANDRKVLFFGIRRSSGFEAAMAITKAAYMTGCDAQASIMGEYYYDLISTGTMTHAYIQSFGMSQNGEYKAFDFFIKENKDKKAPLIMLIDTYDTLESGIENAIKVFKNNDIDDNYEGIYGIRIDSGDLEKYSEKCRERLENAGLLKAKIILTGGLDEKKIQKLISSNTKVDIFGVGDAISLPEKTISTVYKMSKIENKNVMKISNNINKMSYPGDKEIFRIEVSDSESGNIKTDFYDIVSLSERNVVNLSEIDMKKQCLQSLESIFGKKVSENIQNIKKITTDYIINGEKIIKNYELLTLENSKNYFEENRKYLDMIYKDKSVKRVVFSEEIESLKEKLIKKVKG